jgi:hypothetical protein
MQFIYELPTKNNVRQVTSFLLYALLQPLFKILHCSSQHFFPQISDFQGPQRGARHKDILTDWPSVVKKPRTSYNPVWGRVRILPPQSLRVARSDGKGTQWQWCTVMSPPRIWPLTDCTTNYGPILSSERKQQDDEQSKCPVKREERRKIWSWAPKGCPTRRRIGRRPVGHNINSTQHKQVHCKARFTHKARKLNQRRHFC